MDDPSSAETPDGHANGRPVRRRLTIGIAAAASLVLLAGALAAVDRRGASRPTTTEADVNRIVDKKVAKAKTDLDALPPPSVGVYQAIGPPLVVIEADRPGGKAGARSGLGSGVIVNAGGDILTALHVVQGAATVTVSFSDGTRSAATIRSSDPAHDIAVLAPESLPEVVVPAVLGGGARIGDQAFAVGNPLALVASLSAGVISGLDRSFPMGDGRTMDGMIQFDAAVNPGSSGGPLLNRRGEVIGIVTGLANPEGDEEFSGIGFAVPIGTAGGAAGAPAR